MNDAKYIKELEARCETAVAKIGRLSCEVRVMTHVLKGIRDMTGEWYQGASPDGVKEGNIIAVTYQAVCEALDPLSEERGPHKGAPKLKKLEIGPYDEVYEKGMKWLDENG